MLWLDKARSTRLPILALVDLDPHGLDIFSTYKYGSAAMRHECTNLTAPAMIHIGVKHDDLASTNKLRVLSPDSNLDERGLIRMTWRDRSKAQKMLESGHQDLQNELRQLIWLGYKAEIQILGNDLAEYLKSKIEHSKRAIAAAISVTDECLPGKGSVLLTRPL